MQMLHNNDFVAGAAIALVLLSALALSPLFRRMILAAMAFAIIRAYLASGADGLLKTSQLVRIDLISNHPDFSRGLAVGAVLTLLSILIVRLRSA
jgi:hypothetical protein